MSIPFSPCRRRAVHRCRDWAGYPTLVAVVDAVRDGTGVTILIASGTQCVVQAVGRITHKAVQAGHRDLRERTVCEDKAAFALRGRGSAVDGIVFRKFAWPDSNGAGIRTR